MKPRQACLKIADVSEPDTGGLFRIGVEEVAFGALELVEFHAGRVGRGIEAAVLEAQVVQGHNILVWWLCGCRRGVGSSCTSEQEFQREFEICSLVSF